MNSYYAQVASSSVQTRRILSIACILATALVASCRNPVRDEQAVSGQECVYVRVTGSNLPVKECRTAEERAAIAARNREAAEQGVEDLRKLDEFGVESAGAASLE